ncbi:hypothetical protein LMIY3S_00959 [Labrys miyagiensis]
MDQKADTGKNASTPGVRLGSEDRRALYATARFLGRETLENLNLRIPFHVYFKDPSLQTKLPGEEMDTDFRVPWEPGITSGPTSARFAVVDFDGGTGMLNDPAEWKPKENAFYYKGSKLDQGAKDKMQFHQVSAWAVAQNALDFFESSWALGRRILWGFEGNRLIIVPHAGYGQNAYYDRKSKSLQFYYFDDAETGQRVQTCLSTDIVSHEFGHAVLDGIRPYYLEAVSPQTAAFHEFMGDLTAILLVFRNNSFRKELIAQIGTDLGGQSMLSNIAPQFGKATQDRPYLRSATNNLTMKDLEGDREPHRLSQVMTGAMFDILIAISQQYFQRSDDPATGGQRKVGAADAFWWTIQRMQVMAIQPLDLLPPVEVTFRDYALAVLRTEQINNPTDPQGYRAQMVEIFIRRGILDEADREVLLRPAVVFERLDVDVFHDVRQLATSRASAYRFLDDNRAKLFIPRRADIIVSDVFTAEKYDRYGQRQPRQILIQYVWREDLPLSDPQFGRFQGQTTSLLCGGTLAFNENGNILAWARKPGSESFDGAEEGHTAKWKAELETGRARRRDYLGALALRIRAGLVGDGVTSGLGLIEKNIPPLTAREVDGLLRFELSPHFAIHDHDDDEKLGERQWQISS